MGYKHILDPNIITSDGIDEIKRRRTETGIGLFEARRQLLREQRDRAIDVLQLELTKSEPDIVNVLHDTLELMRSRDS